MSRAPLRLVVVPLLLALGLPLIARADFTTFESGHVRPLALSPDGTQLFAVNTPDDHLEIFDVDGTTGQLTLVGSVPVGLEPVAVAARTNGEVWVVNHLSDSVSIVDVASVPPRVVRTLLVGDEPRDIVFAGTGGTRAFITAAHRGQNRPGDPQLTTEGIGRADVWVFDATNLGTSLGGTPLAILTLFSDTPRALAVSPDGSTVYAAAFQSGNETTALNEGAVCNGGASAPTCDVGGTTMPGGLPAPNTNFQSIGAPEVGLIVRRNHTTNHFEDELGRNWDPAVRLSLPDRDVFAIDADDLGATPTPFAHVGTVLFNMVTNPITGRVYVSNTEARNEVRFEGPGVFAGTTVRGHLHEARITVLDGTSVLPHHLNTHIDYDTVPSPPGTADDSLATPLGMAVTADGATLYVAAFGSSKVGVLSTSALEADTLVPDAADHIIVSGGGPTGLVLNAAGNRLYVFTRFDNAVSVIDTGARNELAHLTLHNPEPPAVVTGRPVLYDAVSTSSNGEASCASCHIFGDFDSLGWDLGNPDDTLLANNNPFEFGGSASFHPMKGPMTTQSLRGMANHGPMHWRGDRSGGNNPGGNPLDENAAFNRFIVAFEGLLGRNGAIPTTQMQAFTNFILQVTYPPNPIRALDNSLTPAQDAGRDLYFGRITDAVRNCNGCHVLDPAQGFFGSDGEMSFENETQDFKIPHLRNAYQKVGMFGMPQVPFITGGDNGDKGEQVRGFGFLHDGSVDTIARFHSASVFSLFGTEITDLEQFMLAFDSNLAPIVGQQITLTNTNAATVGPRIDLMIQRAAANECELTVKGVLAGAQRGWLRLANGSYRSDRASEALLSDATLRAQAGVAGQERTYLCVPPGSGSRVGIDRDQEGFFDRDEIDAGSDPADPTSTPGGQTTSTTTSTTSTTSTSTTSTTMLSAIAIPTRRLVMSDDTGPPPNPGKRRFRFTSSTRNADPGGHIVPPAPGSSDDPRARGGLVLVQNAAALTSDVVVASLDPARWRLKGANTWVYDEPQGVVRKIVLKPDRLLMRSNGATWTYSLNEPAQGRVGVFLFIGGDTWCAEAAARAYGNPPSTAGTDRVDRFVGEPNSPPPAICGP